MCVCVCLVPVTTVNSFLLRKVECLKKYTVVPQQCMSVYECEVCAFACVASSEYVCVCVHVCVCVCL